MSTINSNARDGHIEVLASHARPSDVYIRSIGKGPIPVPADTLRRVLDIETPSESWDDMDGGVTAAAVEAEADVASTRGWSGLHTIATAAYWRARAEDAEHALADVHERDETVARLEVQLAKAESGWAEANDRNARQAAMLAEAECHDCIRDAAVIRESRPLTADDVSEAMCTRAADEFERTRSWEATLAAALTEPQRPEGAEKIEAAIREVVPSHPEDRYGDLANRLAERGVRVTTKESR